MLKSELQAKYSRLSLINIDKECEINSLNFSLEQHKESIIEYDKKLNVKQQEVDFWIDENKKLRQECHELASIVLNLVKKGVLNSGNQ